MLPLAATLLFAPAGSATGPPGSYTSSAFSDGFESGGLLGWNAVGNGSAAVTAGAAHTGAFGLEMSNAQSQYRVQIKSLPSAMVDSSTSFWVKVGSGAGFQQLAQARDAGSSTHMWDIAYYGPLHGLFFYPYRDTGSTEIFTGINSVPENTWVHVEIQYTATAAGGARLYLNDQTQANWEVTGDYTRSSNLAIVQVWNDGAAVVDFDDVNVGAPSVAAQAPGAPTNVTGVPGDHAVALSWAAPSSNGGSPITSYRITPYIGSTAQTPITTGTAATNYTLTGLANGTAYTFTIAAINAVGTGPDSAASSAYTPRIGYTELLFADGFESGTLSAWNGAPGSGATSVISSDSHAGTYGLRMTNTAGQYSYLVKSLAAPVIDSSTTFWVKLGTGSGFQSIAQARDGTSSANLWSLYYDWNRGGFSLFPFRANGSSEIFTGLGTGAVGSWMKIEVQYTATTSGGARIFLNGTTQPTWGVSGDYTRATNYQVLQLWDDAVGSTSFDDAKIATQPSQGASLPGAPTGAGGVARDHAVVLSWSAPTSNGGSAINAYRITPYIGNVAQAAVITDYPVTTTTVTGLTNGTAYTFTVEAINGIGAGPASSASLAVTPTAATVPGTPTAVSATPRDGAANVGWTAPVSDGGTPITSYRVTPYIGATAQAPITVSGATTNLTATGLANGTAYTFRVAATNDVGTGSDSAPSTAVTPRPALAQYTNVVFADGFESGNFSSWAGGAQGTGTSTVGAAVARTGAFGARIATQGTQYGFIANLLSSPLTDSVTEFWLRIPAGARVTTVAQARDSSSSQVMWQLAYDGTRQGFFFFPFRSGGGSSQVFTGANTAAAGVWVKIDVEYRADLAGGAQLYINGQTQDAWAVTGDYRWSSNYQRLQLWNDGLSSVDFDDVSVATLPPPGVDPPGAPTNVTGTALDHAASVSWTAPASNGGGALTGYRITPYVGSTAQAPIMTGSAATTYTVAGLTNGVAYTFTVAAVNAAGTGVDSAPSAAITPQPAPPPGPPTNVVAAAGDGRATLVWSAPSSDGGSPIIGYRITPYVGSVAQTPINTGGTGTTYTVTGLTNGTTYRFTVLAVNGSGPGPESVASNAVTPSPPTVPGLPTSVAGSPRDSAVALTWTAPTSDGGSPITGYRITPYIGGAAQAPIATGSAATIHTVTGLTNGTTYTFRVAATNAVGTGANSAASAAVTPAVPPANPIVLENRNQGTTSWKLIDGHKALNQEIEGYASKTSVNVGGTIDLMISLSSNAQYAIDIYRMGWYPQGTNPDGTSCAPSCGGRLMRHVGPLSGSQQAACPRVTTQGDPNFGLVECHWTPSYTLSVPMSWTTGNYIVKLTRADGQQLENYMTFVVRDDMSAAPIVYSFDVTTWQAYNYWGGAGNGSVGQSLYGRYNDRTGSPLSGSQAYAVSFDRPYADGAADDGEGDFFDWDFPMVRYLESQGYDITYVTSVDLEANPSIFVGRKMFTNTGHDEYYSDGMRQRIQDGIASGVNMAFFSANNFYFRIVWAPNSSGVANRRILCDKNSLPNSTTFQWRYLSPRHPENEIGGVMLQGLAYNRPFLVSDASNWIYQGTGLHNYTGNGTDNIITSGPDQNALPGILGYEVDARASTTSDLTAWAAFEPPGLQSVAHSFVWAVDGNASNTWSDATLYTAPNGGGIVFSAGTIRWSWGVDPGYLSGYCGCSPGTFTNAATQRITSNIINRFIQ